MRPSFVLDSPSYETHQLHQNTLQRISSSILAHDQWHRAFNRRWKHDLALSHYLRQPQVEHAAEYSRCTHFH